MAKQNLQFKGFPELAQVLDALSPAIAKQVGSTILSNAVKPLVKEAKRLSSNADVSGDTTKSIGIIRNRNNKSVTVGPRRGGQYKGWYAHILEYGSTAHVIRPTSGKALTFLGGVFKSANHPGTVAQPFMRPAFDSTYPQVIESVKQQCATIIASNFKSIKF